ncbi:putative odorant receptor 71a [Bradysia coprophila]|uniref:putative odorant receptor 71a n=1 Tax=Bradysia coprophila TaxID=38358 RepID=UPI00187DD671|nr:putative odorant receptor 71a [Bradysia coprophila]
MYPVQIHPKIEKLISFFYRIGVWSGENEETGRGTILKIFYSLYFSLAVISVISGAFLSDNKDETIFLTQISINCTVLLVKLVYLIWRKSDILELMHQVCTFYVDDREELTLVNDKLNNLLTFSVFVFGSVNFAEFSSVVIVPISAHNERQLFFNIGFPLDYKNSDLAYWLADLYLATGMIFVTIALFFSVIVWYLMANCGLRYKLLGQQIKYTGIKTVKGRSGDKRQTSDSLYRQDLKNAIAKHQTLEDLTTQLDSFLSKFFGVQFATSGFCICCSIFCIVFNRGLNWLEQIIQIVVLVYSIFDIFMITYFGNHILSESERLSYYLFESEWVNQQLSTKKIVLLFAEFLNEPRQLVILKIYPLTLETFKRIMNSAYSMFNVLQNFK